MTTRPEFFLNTPPAIPDTMALIILVREGDKNIVHKVDNVEFIGFNFDPTTGNLQFLGRMLQHPGVKTKWTCQTTEDLNIGQVFASAPPATTARSTR